MFDQGRARFDARRRQHRRLTRAVPLHETFAAAWEASAWARADAPALVHGDRRVTWESFERRASSVAAALAEAGLRAGDAFAQYLPNAPEYLESVFAAFKGRFVPVNTNYRYREDELAYLWGDAGAAAVVFDASFGETIERVRARLAAIRCWLCVGEPVPDWARPYESAADAGGAPPARPSGDDVFLLYTGGTTGLPRGVVWRQRDLMAYLETASPAAPPRLRSNGVRVPVERVHLSASPLMHGTGSFNAFGTLTAGGAVVTLPGISFRAPAFLDAVAEQHATSAAVVGDAFCRPILEALDAEPDRRDLGSLCWLVSSGAIWSAEVKQRLLAHLPGAVLVDALSSSEAPGMAASFLRAGESAATAAFTAGPSTLVLDDEGGAVPDGSGRAGLIAVTGYLPVGYHNDAEKTAATFREHEGTRYSVPGDYATIDADRTLHLLGRGAAVINTGGEKVFAEEVEDALKSHDGVRDAVVVGVPDELLGERVVAVVSGGAADEQALIAHVRSRLAGYKTPKAVVFAERIVRGPSGKVDLAWARATAALRNEGG